MCIQKILKLENQNKELQEQKETLEIKLQEKTEEMKGTITKRRFKGVVVGESCEVGFSAKVKASYKSNINAEFTVNSKVGPKLLLLRMCSANAFNLIIKLNLFFH